MEKHETIWKTNRRDFSQNPLEKGVKSKLRIEKTGKILQ